VDEVEKYWRAAIEVGFIVFLFYAHANPLLSPIPERMERGFV
jgi:hypothetical protein